LSRVAKSTYLQVCSLRPCAKLWSVKRTTEFAPETPSKTFSRPGGTNGLSGGTVTATFGGSPYASAVEWTAARAISDQRRIALASIMLLLGISTGSSDG
jgi:hypothetical protein